MLVWVSWVPYKANPTLFPALNRRNDVQLSIVVMLNCLSHTPRALRCRPAYIFILAQMPREGQRKNRGRCRWQVNSPTGYSEYAKKSIFNPLSFFGEAVYTNMLPVISVLLSLPTSVAEPPTTITIRIWSSAQGSISYLGIHETRKKKVAAPNGAKEQ